MEMAEYFLASIEMLAEEDIEIHIVHLKLNKEAPFQFRKLDKVRFYERNDFDLDELHNLCTRINPDAIFCAGWVDKTYNKICRAYVKQIPVILLLDNQWSGNIKQQIARLISPFFMRKLFSHIWVSGDPQKLYAKKLGYDDLHIKPGYYCADTELFDSIRQRFAEEKSKHFPRKFLFVGRYSEFKGIENLWKAFSDANKNHDWKLVCVGTGDLWDERHISDDIEHLGFIQPADLGEVIRQCGIFILPSHFEPWGVVIHEMAAAGMPIISSDAVGASTMFVKDEVNGWMFKAGNTQDLTNKLLIAMDSSEESLQKMSEASIASAAKLTTAHWTNTLREFL
jgi:glycosyltransferase involved in cell wall biosynthesis